MTETPLEALIARLRTLAAHIRRMDSGSGDAATLEDAATILAEHDGLIDELSEALRITGAASLGDMARIARARAALPREGW